MTCLWVTGDTCMNLFALGAGIILDMDLFIRFKAISLFGILNAMKPEFEETKSRFGKLGLTFTTKVRGPGLYFLINLLRILRSALSISSYGLIVCKFGM